MISIHLPSLELSRYVANYFVYDLTEKSRNGQPVRAAVFPDTFSIGCFIWGDTVKATNQLSGVCETRSGISGFQTRRFEVEGFGRQGVIIARFTALGIRCLLPCPPSDFVNVRVDLRDVYDSLKIEHLEEQLFNAEDFPTRIAYVEKFLLLHLHAGQVDLIVESTMRNLWLSEYQLSMAYLASQYELSVSTLHRRFVQAIGVGPKKYARIIRLKKAFLHFEKNKSWAEAALFAGFYDQAHLIRESNSVYQETPEQHMLQSPVNYGIRS